MRRLLLFGAAMALPVIAGGGDRAYFVGNAAAGPWDAVETVNAGYARIDDALDRLVPENYRIVIEQSIPEYAILAWPRSTDWVTAVRAGLESIGLEMRIDSKLGVVEVRRAKARIQIGRINRVDLSDAPVQAEKNETKQSEDVDTFFVDRLSFPNEEQMRRIWRVVGNGGQVALKGYSGTVTEAKRIYWANTFARNMKNKLIAKGILEKFIVVEERTEYKATTDKPNVEFILRGESNEK